MALRARSAVLLRIPDGSFKSFENYTVKILAKETKWTSFEVRIPFLEAPGNLTGPGIRF